MTDEFFIIGFTALVAFLLAWGFKTLPSEKWQFIAAVPTRKQSGGAWSAINFTYYGFFSATAYLIAISIFCILLGAVVSV